MNVPGNTDPQPKMVIIHQNLIFFPNAVMVTWRAFNAARCVYYQLVVSHSCDLNSNTIVLINRTKKETIILEPEALSNFTYFHLTVHDEQGDQHEELSLESFQFGPGSKLLYSHSCTIIIKTVTGTFNNHKKKKKKKK